MKYIATYDQRFQAEINASNLEEARKTALVWSYPWRAPFALNPALLRMQPKQAPEDLSRCVWCGSDEFLADTTDTWTATLDKDGRPELHKSYPGDVHNVNCAKCGEPAHNRSDYD